MRELRAGLWHWQAPHPGWTPDERWPQKLTAEQAGDGSPDPKWLRDGGVHVCWYAGGDRLAIGIEAYAGREHNDLVLWIEGVRAVLTGDSLGDLEAGFGLNK